MNKTINILLLLLLPFTAHAAGGIQLQEADIDLTDKASLQRGAKYYVKYCLGCHSVKYIRYLNMTDDFDADKETVLQDIAPVGAGIYDKMLSAMNAHDANKWFGTKPPDLSLIARSRGTDWLYSYLKGFYADPSKPLGVNNAVFKDVGMPNPLWQLQGIQEPVFKKEDGQKVIAKLVIKESGTMSPEQFDDLVNDMVNFLAYAGEPHQLERQRLGKYVLLFILLFGVIAYLLKKEYWKGIH
jgi:ubiquinol-cytochrome c reductase cytochrome c1 subunit